MDTQPKIPTLKDSQKPQVKVRGLEAGVTLFDRLKQFKKKDLAFILAGLGTLFMAPLAEHFMMSPETGDGNQLTAGWKGGAGSKGMFDGSGSSPYEPGVSGLAPGSAVGGGSDIITPLNVRDPSALVMGPGATQQPPTNSVMPSTPPPTAPVTHSDSDLKDALAASARGVGAAAHAAKALLPIPKISLSGQGGLRGLGVVSGGSSASSGGPISSQGIAPGKAAQGNNLPGVTGAKGVTAGGRGLTAGSGSSVMDALKAAGDKAAGAFNRGPAETGLNNAASTVIPAGGGANGGAGQGASGVTDKANGGDSTKDGKSVGESLAFLKQKAMQEAQIALWAKEQEAGDSKLELLKIRNTMAESIAGSVASAVGGQIGCLIVPSGSTCVNSPGGVTSYSCNLPTAAAGAAPLAPISSSIVGTTPQSCQATPAGPNGANGAGGTAAANGKVYYYDGNGGLFNCTPNGPGSLYANCTPNGPVAPGSKKTTTPPGVQDLGGIGNVSGSPMTDLKGACAALTQLQTDLTSYRTPSGQTTPAQISVTQGNITTLLTQAKLLVQIRDTIGASAGTSSVGSTPTIAPSGDCLATAMLPGIKSGDAPVASQLNSIVGVLMGGGIQPYGIAQAMRLSVTATDPADDHQGMVSLNGLNKQVSDPTSGPLNTIPAFASDVGALQTANGQVSQTAPSDPLGLLTLHSQLGANWDSSVAAAAAGAATTIQKSAQTSATAVANLNQAVSILNPLVTPQTGLLAGSFGDNGTLAQVVKANGTFDTTGGANAKPPLPSPLKSPALTAQKGDGDGTATTQQVTTDVGTANKDITDLTTKLSTLAAAPDPKCTTTPCTDAQTALTTAGTDIRLYQADQTAVNAAILAAAKQAGALAGPGASTTPTPGP